MSRDTSSHDTKKCHVTLVSYDTFLMSYDEVSCDATAAHFLSRYPIDKKDTKDMFTQIYNKRSQNKSTATMSAIGTVRHHVEPSSEQLLTVPPRMTNMDPKKIFFEPTNKAQMLRHRLSSLVDYDIVAPCERAGCWWDKYETRQVSD